jgi:hypothetical protein
MNQHQQNEQGQEQPQYQSASIRHYTGDVRLVSKTRHQESFTIFSPEIKDRSEFDPSLPNLADDPTLKILFDNSAPYGHILSSWLGNLLIDLDKHRDEKITIVMSKSPNKSELYLDHLSSLTEYLEKKFISMGYQVKYLDTDSFFYVENFIYYDTTSRNLEFRHRDLKAVSDFLSSGIDYSVRPTEKVYLSRGKTTTYNGNTNVSINPAELKSKADVDNIRKDYKYKFTNRIDDEQAIEDYLYGLGFTIIYPEDFTSYEEQLLLISRARILMSLTSSSLSACLAMAPDSVVVEIATPQPTISIADHKGNFVPETADYHPHYKNLSAVKNNIHISIANDAKSASKVIATIEASKALKDLLSS